MINKEILSSPKNDPKNQLKEAISVLKFFNHRLRGELKNKKK